MPEPTNRAGGGRGLTPRAGWDRGGWKGLPAQEAAACRPPGVLGGLGHTAGRGRRSWVPSTPSCLLTQPQHVGHLTRGARRNLQRRKFPINFDYVCSRRIEHRKNFCAFPCLAWGRELPVFAVSRHSWEMRCEVPPPYPSSSSSY